MLLGLGLNLNKGGFISIPYYSVLASAFRSRVQSDGGQVGNISCLKSELKELNPTKPAAFTGLLNDYSGAAAAYSLRLLDNTYTGDAIVVTTNGSNSASIGFVNNELDTASLEAFAGSGDAYVSVWYDQSGNGNNATNTNFSEMPKIVSGGTFMGYIENQVVNFAVLLSAFSYTAGTPFSSFMVVQNFGKSVFGGTNSGSIYYGVAENTTSSATAGFGSVYYYSNGSSIGTQRRDIYNAATTSFAQLTTLATLSIGSSEAVLGYNSSGYNSTRMKEYIIYDNQSVSRTGVENNIITHYGF